MANHLGSYNTSVSRTHVGDLFTTNDGSGGAVAPSTAFEAADLDIYRAADGAAFSATPRSSASGITMTSPFNSVVGLHAWDIDLTDNTDAGFYATGYRYMVVLSPDETVDAQIVVKVLAYFEIGPPPVNTVQSAGTTIYNSDGTLAGATPGVSVTFPATDSAGVAIPDDARFEYCVFLLGDGQLLLTTTKVGTRAFGYLASATPVNPSGKTYILQGTYRTDASIPPSWFPENFTDATFTSAGVFSVAALANAPTGGSAPTTAQIADKILARNLAGGSDGGRTVQDALRFLRNRWTRTSTTLTVYAEDDSTTAWSSTLIVTAGASPVTSSDPG